MLNKFVFLVALLLSTNSWASGKSGPISQILIYETSNLVYVYPTGGLSSPPACHGSNGDYFSFSLTRPHADKYLDALLSAHARQASVSIFGLNACVDQSVSETINFIRIND
ncbi:MAG: hypothetical protein JKY66_05400 [Spongiibacteraceae bacterium]|nr:hypothetical protein [Spongiibacteraceae bacterium]